MNSPSMLGLRKASVGRQWLGKNIVIPTASTKPSCRMNGEMSGEVRDDIAGYINVGGKPEKDMGDASVV